MLGNGNGGPLRSPSNAEQTDRLTPERATERTSEMAYATANDGAKRTVLMLMVVIFIVAVNGQMNPGDVQAIQDLFKTLGLPFPTDPCRSMYVTCSAGRVTMLKLAKVDGLAGKTLPPSLNKLTGLTSLELHSNNLGGALPSLSGMSSLSSIMIQNNNFTSIPPDFFSSLTGLRSILLDDNPSLAPWSIPDGLKNASSLQKFSATNANIVGTIPPFLGGSDFPNLQFLSLAYNNLTGGIPDSFAVSGLKQLWLNSQRGSKLSGRIDIIANMSGLEQLWLNVNNFSGPLPDFSRLTSLYEIRLRDNQFTGPVPSSLISLPSLKNVTLSNNFLQGRYPKFADGVGVDNDPSLNRFCLNIPGECDPKVTVLLSIASSIGYPASLAGSWRGNDACSGWQSITCDSKGNIIVINFQNQHFVGTISPDFGSIPTLQRLLLSNNDLTGTIPPEITKIPALTLLDLSNNNIWGKVPPFPANVQVVTTGNPLIGKDPPPPGPPGSGGGNDSSGSNRPTKIAAVIGVISAVCILVLISLFVYKKKRNSFVRVQNPDAVLIHPQSLGSDHPDVLRKSSVENAMGINMQSPGIANPINIQVESVNMVIAIEVLRNVTNNFSEENILGKGGFGTVYKGELHDGTKIAVKRMQSAAISSKALNEFTSEINVLTRVRHRHLVALLGYCLDGNEKLLVYEYMPQGTLSRHLFNWKEEGMKPLEWKKRLSIALDVGRGVEYLHSLARESFIHRDLKPSNILLGDDMRAKVADFGLVRLAPPGKCSVETSLAGTFGYMAPELTATGRVTSKTDVYSFGAILMELICGRRVLDNNQPEDRFLLVTWFRRMHLNKETFKTAIDTSLEVTPETLPSILTVAELAFHCCAREPHQRPAMSHVVSVLSPLVDQWKPTADDADDCYGINLDITLSEAIKKWQEDTQMSDGNFFPDSATSTQNTRTSMPPRPYGFPNSLASVNGR